MTEVQSQQKPSIGRIVHYVMRSGDFALPIINLASREGEHKAAIIVGLRNLSGDPETVNLQVFTDYAYDGHKAPLYVPATKYSNFREPGTWHWPERED